MPNYSCENCGKEFSQKSHYDSHKRRKKPCENYSNKIQIMVDKKVQETINDLNLKNLKNLILINDELNNQKHNVIDTFKDLYEFLQICEEENIIKWLEEPWIGKDKQESLLRLFAGLGLHRLKRKMRQNYLLKIKLSIISLLLFDKINYQISGVKAPFFIGIRLHLTTSTFFILL